MSILFLDTCFALLRSWGSPVPIPSAFKLALETFSAESRRMSHYQRSTRTPYDGQFPVYLLFEVVVAEEKGSKHMKLLLSYDVTVQHLALLWAELQSLLPMAFLLWGHTTILHMGVWGCFPSYITHSFPPEQQAAKTNNLQFTLFDVRWDRVTPNQGLQVEHSWIATESKLFFLSLRREQTALAN